MFSLLFLEENSTEILSYANAVDLGLNSVLNTNSLHIVCRKCSETEISARQSFFKCMENTNFINNLRTFYEDLQKLQRCLSVLESVPSSIERLFALSNYAKAFLKTMHHSNFLVAENLYIVEHNLTSYLKTAISNMQQIETIILQLDSLLGNYRILVVTPSGKVNNCSNNSANLSTQLLAFAKECDWDLSINRHSASRQLPRFIIEEIAEKRHTELFDYYAHQIHDLADSRICNLISELDFYFFIHEIKETANKYNIPTCYATISKTPCFVANDLYNIALLTQLHNKIVPNDTWFTPENSFYLLSGANSGGKTSYLQAIAINLILFLSGCPIFCLNAEIYPFAKILTHFCVGNPQTSKGSFFDERDRLDSCLELITTDSFLFINEPFTTTNQEKATETIREIIDTVAYNQTFGVLVTHFPIEGAQCPSLHVVVTQDTNFRTYKIAQGEEGNSFAASILEKYRLDKKALKGG